MIERRPFESLGGADHGWLDAKHHFSFAGYHDPERMGWGALRVWNDDTIAAEHRLPAAPHADMEIITYVREGAITHQDSLGNEGRTEAGDVQVMSAGTGIRHAEYNLEAEHDAHLPDLDHSGPARRSPSWGAKPFPKGDRAGRFVALASGIERGRRRAADPHRRARARRDPQGRRDGRIRARERSPRLSRAGQGRRRGQWRAHRCARRRGDPRRSGRSA